MSDDMIPRPPESVNDVDDADRRNDVYNRIAAIVETHATFGESATDSPGTQYVARVRIPYRTTAYKHDIHDDVVERYDATPPVNPTDGFVSAQSPIFITVDCARKRAQSELLSDDVDDPESTIRDRMIVNLADFVFKSLRDGTVSKPITVDVAVEDGVEAQSIADSDDPTPPDAYDRRFETKTVGRATYKVDGIVPPDAFDP